MADIIETLKKAALQVYNSVKPAEIVFGKVKSVKPFEIDVEQKLPLTEEFIVIGQYVKEYSLDLTIDGEMWHGFRIGDELILERMQGGDRYIISDWVKRADEDTRPAWIMTGEVVSEAPEIKINDYFTIKADQLILCENVKDYHTYLSFDNPKIKQKINIYNRSESEILPKSVYAGDEPHIPRDDDIPPPFVASVTDMTFNKKQYENTSGIKDENGDIPETIELPAFHEITVYNGLHIGDLVFLVCDRVSRKWYVVDYIKRIRKPAAEQA